MLTEEQKRKKRIWNAKNKHKNKKYYEDNKILILSKMKAYRDSNQEIIRERKKKYNKTEKAKELSRKRNKKYYYKNKDLLSKKYKEYYYNNLDKIYLIKKKTRQKRKALDLAYVRMRQANKIKATPKWANLEKIKEIYLNCPIGYHVDHVIPLNNSIVCGLHVEYNLQYLTAKENIKKSNKFDV